MPNNTFSCKHARSIDGTVADPEIINGVQKGKYYGERGEPESCPVKLKKIWKLQLLK